MKEITITIGDDLYRYLSFLEKRGAIKSKEEAAVTALTFYKMLSVHDWLPYIYRMGGDRVLIISETILMDLFQTLTNEETYSIGEFTAWKRRTGKPELSKADLTNPENWGVMLRELEILGWGKFTRVGKEVKVDFCTIPIPFLHGYLETLFQTQFKVHRMKKPRIVVFVPSGRKGGILGHLTL